MNVNIIPLFKKEGYILFCTYHKYKDKEYYSARWSSRLRTCSTLSGLSPKLAYATDWFRLILRFADRF